MQRLARRSTRSSASGGRRAAHLAQRGDNVGVLRARTATASALNGLTHELERIADQVLKLVQPQSTAAFFLDIVLTLFTLCHGTAILLGSPEQSGGMGAYLQLAYVIALFLVLLQGPPAMLDLALAVG